MGYWMSVILPGFDILSGSNNRSSMDIVSPLTPGAHLKVTHI